MRGNEWTGTRMMISNERIRIRGAGIEEDVKTMNRDEEMRIKKRDK